MKLFLFFLLLIFNTEIVFSQNLSTNQQVYNFEVGDVFQFSEYSSSWVGGYAPGSKKYTYEYVSKIYSVNSDTIFYGCIVSIYSYPTCQSCSASYSSSQWNYFVTDLNSPANHFNITPYCFPLDTSEVNNFFCGLSGWQLSPNSDSMTCSSYEIDSETSIVSEGFGKIYSYRVNFGGWYATTKTLSYYKKQNDSCGTFLNTKEIPVSDGLLFIYPNPASDLITLSFDHELHQYFIYDIQGKELSNGVLSDNKINISFLPAGIYLIKLSGKNDEINLLKFLKE